MRRLIVSLWCFALVTCVASRAYAQPTLSVTPIEVPPGATVTATISGAPGQAWGLGGSFSGSGLVYGGATLALGTDAVALGYGILDASGAASVTFKPPIGPTTPLYYIQAITAADLSFAGAQATQSFTLRPAGIFTHTPLLPQGLAAGNARIVGVGEPVDGSDAATKAYVDSVGGGVASQSAGGDLTGSYPNPGISSGAGANIVSAINATGGTIADARLPGTLARLNAANVFSAAATFSAGLSASNARIQFVGPPAHPMDAVNKLYVDASFAKLFAPNSGSSSSPVLSLEQLGSGELMRLRVNSTTVPGANGVLINRDQAIIRSDGGFVFTGELGIGVIPATGAGARAQWYPAKAAFRAGGLEGPGASNWDDANIGIFSFAGGHNTIASGAGSFAYGDTISVTGTVGIGLGNGHDVSGVAAFAAGSNNVASGSRSTAIGFGSRSAGLGSAAIGDHVAACGNSSVALGFTASTSSAPSIADLCGGTAHLGVFVFGDRSTSSLFGSVANNEFAARASGGFRFRTNAFATTGCNLPAGSGVFACSSDRNLKSGFENLDGEDVLRRLAAIPVTRWRFNDEAAGVTHVGPTAQDFHAAFGLGESDTMIGYTDINGINMRAIQALEARTRDLQGAEDRIRQLEERLQNLEAQIEALLALRR